MQNLSINMWCLCVKYSRTGETSSGANNLKSSAPLTWVRLLHVSQHLCILSMRSCNCCKLQHWDHHFRSCLERILLPPNYRHVSLSHCWVSAWGWVMLEPLEFPEVSIVVDRGAEQCSGKELVLWSLPMQRRKSKEIWMMYEEVGIFSSGPFGLMVLCWMTPIPSIIV